MFEIGLLVWWMIGFIGILIIASKNEDITITGMIMYALLGMSGIIGILVMIAAVHGDKVVIKRRPTMRR